MDLISNPATAYHLAHRGKLMVLTQLKNATPERHEFCRVRTVETLHPGLWITASFLDGSIRRFRPEKIRAATLNEEQIAELESVLETDQG